MKELHIISTGRQSIHQITEIIRDIHPYIDGFHLREKQLGARELFEIVQQLHVKGVPLSKIYINDRVDVSVVAKTRGVQLSYQSLDVQIVKKSFPRLRVGCSVHSLDEALEKEQQGADFLIYGHIFETASKPGLPPRGVFSLREICDAVSIPVLAIGGIHPENIPQVLKTKVAGIAVMSGVLESVVPMKTVQQYYDLVKNCK